MRQVLVKINGSAVTPEASGFCKTSIKQVIDNGVGDYTVILKRPFNRDNAVMPDVMIQSLTADRISTVVATAYDRFTVNFTDEAGVAADADFSAMMIGSDARLTR